MVIYDVYHDESDEDAYWHAFLFVPRTTARTELLKLLKASRVHTGYKYPKKLHFKEISGDPMRIGRKSRAHCAECWTTIGLASLQQQGIRSGVTQIYLGEVKLYNGPVLYRSMDKFSAYPRCKLAIFKERDNLRQMNPSYYNDDLDKVETTFTMGLKGALHYLFPSDEQVRVGKIFLDGDEHNLIKHKRGFDCQKVERKLRQGLRENIVFEDGFGIQVDTHDRDDLELLQLTDIMLGGVRFQTICPKPAHMKHKVSACLVRTLLDPSKRILKRHKNSRLYRGMDLSEAWLDGGEWQFDWLVPAQVSVDRTVSMF